MWIVDPSMKKLSQKCQDFRTLKRSIKYVMLIEGSQFYIVYQVEIMLLMTVYVS